MKKPFPQINSDAEAEQFIETADLSEYDFSGFKRVEFEFKKKDASVHLRMSEPLLAAVRVRAKHDGVPYQRFMRLAIERALQDAHPKP